jgi:hypothetical protein
MQATHTNMNVKKVSNDKIKVSKSKDDGIEIKGSDWLPTKYPNCYACSLKGSGKTTVLTNLMWHMIGSDTKIIIISPTIQMDKTWIATVKKLEKKGYNVETFSSINEIDDGQRFNVIADFMEENKEVDSDSDDEYNSANNHRIPQQPQRGLLLDPFKKPPPITPQGLASLKKSQKKKVKKITPKYIIIIDDCGNECRDKNLEQLMKTNRHWKSMVLISSQSLNDLTPNQIRQLQYVFLFARFSYDKLESLYKSLDLSIDLDKFLELYHDATKEKYGFLYIGREASGDKYRKGFQYEYQI